MFGVFRPLVYMLYISSILCLFYLGGMGHLNNVSFLGQTITGGTIDYCPSPRRRAGAPVRPENREGLAAHPGPRKLP